MLLKIAEKSYLAILYEMDFSDEQIKKRMKKRVISSGIVFSLIVASCLILGLYVLLPLAFLIAFLVFKLGRTSISKEYEKFQMDRELAFTRFTQLIIPYLKKDKSQDTLYVIFSKLLIRADLSIKRDLFILMNEMVASPNKIDPFEKFARKCSGKDYAINIMHSLFDYANNTMDISVVEELSEQVNSQLLKRVNDVIQMKNKKASKRPMLLAMSLLVVMIPYLLIYVVNQFMKTGLLGG